MPDGCIYTADMGYLPDGCMWTTSMSFIADELNIDDDDVNGASTDKAGVSVATGRNLMVDLMIFLSKSNSNSRLVRYKINSSFSSHLINSSFI